jgi:uncharacterized protein (TIGR00299 family) protein
MTTIAYFDCFSGIAGDMILGALIDCGVDSKYLKEELEKLELSGYTIEVKKVKKNNITATDVYIDIDETQQHRNLSDINNILDNSKLDEKIVTQSKAIFQRLAEAESKVHNIDIDEVHFHEVGAIDSILDIVGSVLGLHALKIGTVYSSALPLGSGFVTCAHGTIPIPAPATVELLQNIPVYQSDATHEMVTPTGAAFITTIAKDFGKIPPMKIKRIGYGAGKIQSNQPGLLRIYIGQIEKKKIKI